MAVAGHAATRVHEVDLQDAAAVNQAMLTIAQAHADDTVSLYLCKPGAEQNFLLSEMAEHLLGGQHTLLALSDYSCCALIEELHRQARPPAEVGGSVDASCSAADAASAAVQQHARSNRLDGVALLYEQPVLHRLVEEHGGAICLHLIGVQHERRGEGLGSRMLQHIAQVADSRGLLCYLEASSARSQALYERHGFEHTADKPLGEDAAAPVLWVGVRPPAAAAAAAGSSS